MTPAALIAVSAALEELRVATPAKLYAEANYRMSLATFEETLAILVKAGRAFRKPARNGEVLIGWAEDAYVQEVFEKER